MATDNTDQEGMLLEQTRRVLYGMSDFAFNPSLDELATLDKKIIVSTGLVSQDLMTAHLNAQIARVARAWITLREKIAPYHTPSSDADRLDSSSQAIIQLPMQKISLLLETRLERARQQYLTEEDAAVFEAFRFVVGAYTDLHTELLRIYTDNARTNGGVPS